MNWSCVSRTVKTNIKPDSYSGQRIASQIRVAVVLTIVWLLPFLMSACSGGAAGNLIPRGTAVAPSAGTPGLQSSSAPAAASILNAPSVSLLTFGNAGYGGDDTNVLQNALNTTAVNGQVLRVPAGSYNISPISFPANSQLALDAGAVFTANAGYGPQDKMLKIESQNVVIAGAGAASVIFQMRKSEYAAEHATDQSEYRHCLDIEGATNVTVSGISCNKSGGDGLYIGAGAQKQPSQNITVSDSIFDQNFRQGFSLISGQHIFIDRCHFTNTEGTAPEAGIDVEPNDPSGAVVDVHFEDNFTDNNAGPGVKLALWLMTNASPKIDVTILRHHSDSNELSGYDANNADMDPNVQGQVLIQDSFSTDDGSYGAVAHWYQASGPALIFKNLTITNPHQNGPDPSYHDSAAIGVVRGGGGKQPIGNVQFETVNVSVTNGKVDRYFNFGDSSNKAVENVVFTPGNLSGATQVPPNGLMNSAGANSVGQ